LAFLSLDTDAAGLADALCRWDCVWYEGIATNGYDSFPVPGERPVGNWAFFPLYPAIVAALAAIVPAPIDALAMVTSSALTIGTCILTWPMIGRDRATYALLCAFLLAGPFSTYFTIFMSEPLFA